MQKSVSPWLKEATIRQLQRIKGQEEGLIQQAFSRDKDLSLVTSLSLVTLSLVTLLLAMNEGSYKIVQKEKKKKL